MLETSSQRILYGNLIWSSSAVLIIGALIVISCVIYSIVPQTKFLNTILGCLTGFWALLSLTFGIVLVWFITTIDDNSLPESKRLIAASAFLFVGFIFYLITSILWFKFLSQFIIK